MEIRRFKESDASAVSELIRTTIQISNKKDYPADLMDALIQTETPEHVMGRASWTHFYVVEDENGIIGCGAIGLNGTSRMRAVCSPYLSTRTVRAKGSAG